MLNKAMVIGNLGQDPEMRYTANGNAVTTFSVASGRKYTDNAGEKREEVEWFRVVAWNRLAETCAQYLVKGQQVYVEGRIQTRSWEGPDGAKRYTTELIAQEVKFLGRRPDGGGAAAPADDWTPRPDQAGDIDPDDLPF